MKVLGIETSCDETGIALYDSANGLLAHALHTQVQLHAMYGGVVPELASRDHIHRLIPLVEQVCNQAQISPNSVDGIAYTEGPGLIGALFVGASFAKALAYARGIPAIGIHHLEGHLLAPMLEKSAPSFPFIALLVSGGHTLLVKVAEFGRYEILGQSLDDAAGEAFDKTAKLLQLGYPGGPQLEILAKKGDPARFHFPRPLCDRPGLDFSFSGLKTFALNTLKKSDESEQTRADIAIAFQNAVVDTLLFKIQRAWQQTDCPNWVIAGGVGANLALRQRLTQWAEEKNCQVFFPRLEFCTDNGAMIAYAGCQRLLRGYRDADWGIRPKARWALNHLDG